MLVLFGMGLKCFAHSRRALCAATKLKYSKSLVRVHIAYHLNINRMDAELLRMIDWGCAQSV